VKTFYILGTGQDGMGKKEGLYTLIADDGEFLASHFCSHACYADGDLWKNRPERKEKWEKRFGEYKVVWLGEDDMKLETLIERNKEWAKRDKEAQKKIEENGCSVKIETS
jgi:hypothetical protein